VSAVHLKTVLSDLLDMSQAAHEGFQLEHNPVNISDSIVTAIKILCLHHTWTDTLPEWPPKDIDDDQYQQKKQRVVRCHMASDVPHVVTSDGTRLCQILINVLHNAVKFTTQGGRVDIIVQRAPASSQAADDNSLSLKFQVRDDGIGIASDNVEKVFEPFWQEERGTTRKYGGAGLGMTISKKIVEAMGGSISIASEGKGKGTIVTYTIVVQKTSEDVTSRATIKGQDRFTVFSPMPLLTAPSSVQASSSESETATKVTSMPLPVGSSEHQESKEKDNDDASSSTAVPQRDTPTPAPMPESAMAPISAELMGGVELNKSLKILVVEDNLINQRLCKRLLNKLGYNPEMVDDGKAAVEIVRTMNFDVIFMDLHMPHMNGIDATRIIMNMPTAFKPQIYALTASLSEEERTQCWQAGMVGHVPKPFSLNLFVNVLQKASTAKKG